MQRYDTKENSSKQQVVSSKRGKKIVVSSKYLVAKGIRKLLFHLCYLLFTTCYLLLATGYFLYAQEAGQQRQAQTARQGNAAATSRETEKKTIEEERLNILKDDIRKEIDQYKKLKKDIDDAQKSLDEQNREKLAKVVKMFEAMPADEAARKMEKLDDDIAVSILSALKPKTAGKILAQMENEKAAALSQKILARGKVAPEKTSQ